MPLLRVAGHAYAAAISACSAGQDWARAVALFDDMTSRAGGPGKRVLEINNRRVEAKHQPLHIWIKNYLHLDRELSDKKQKLEGF